MSKNNLKIKFTYSDTTVTLEWKDHEYSRDAVADFLNAFVDMLQMNLNVVNRTPFDALELNEREWMTGRTMDQEETTNNPNANKI